MDREIFLQDFSKDVIPAWRCPACGGHLKLAAGRLLDIQTAASQEEQQHNFSEWDWIKSTATAMFQCSNCNEPVACAAHGWVEEVYSDDEENGGVKRDYEPRWSPRFFEPPLVLMDIPEACPEPVQRHLQSSFSMYFCNPGAAANSARIAVEVLLDHWGIANKTPGGYYISLANRLKEIPQQFAHLAEHLLAAKWLGNDGSHGEDMTKEDVNTLYEILEHALHEVFDDRKEKILAKARGINISREKR